MWILAPLTLSLAGCASTVPPTPPAGLKIPVDNLYRQPCPRAPLPARKTDPATGQPSLQVGQAESFGVAEEASLDVCDGRRASLVTIIDAHNALLDQAQAKIAKLSKPWWKIWP